MTLNLQSQKNEDKCTRKKKKIKTHWKSKSTKKSLPAFYGIIKYWQKTFYMKK